MLDVFNKTAKTVNRLSSFDDLAYAKFESKGGGGGGGVRKNRFTFQNHDSIRKRHPEINADGIY